MAPLPVRGTEISSAPCSVERAAGLLRQFLSSGAAAEASMAKGYLETVTQTLEDMVLRRKLTPGSSKKVLKGPTISRGSVPGLFDDMETGSHQEAKQKHQDLKKTKKKAQAMIDFEALLGHEMETTSMSEFDQRLNGDLVLDEKSGITEMVASTPGSAMLDDNDTETMKSKTKKKKKKKRSGLDEAPKHGSDFAFETLVQVAGDARDVSTAGPEIMDDNEMEGNRSKKKKKKKLEENVESGSPPAIDSVDKQLISVRVEDGIKEAAENGSRKKKKKHKDHAEQGDYDLMDRRVQNGEPAIRALSSEVEGRVGEGDDSELQESKHKKKTKKRSSEASPGDANGQPRVSKKKRKSE